MLYMSTSLLQFSIALSYITKVKIAVNRMNSEDKNTKTTQELN